MGWYQTLQIKTGENFMDEWQSEAVWGANCVEMLESIFGSQLANCVKFECFD